MQAIPCALADITRSPAALDALRIIVDRVHVVKTAVYLLCKRWMRAGTAEVPVTETGLVQLFKDAFYVLNMPNIMHSKQQQELRAMVTAAVSTDAFSSAWVLQEARRFAASVADFITAVYPAYLNTSFAANCTAKPVSENGLDKNPLDYLPSLLSIEANMADAATPFVDSKLRKDTAINTYDLVCFLPDQIFKDMGTTQQEIKEFLKLFKKPKSKHFKSRSKTAKAFNAFTNAHNLIWNLVLDFSQFPLNTGSTFQSRIQTDGEACSVYFLNKVF